MVFLNTQSKSFFCNKKTAFLPLLPSISILRVLASLILLVCTQNIFAQESIKKTNTDKSYHPKTGLVLSGGGAKGLAHIGVLKVLERAGIKIDYIGGSSMGSVIGGLYASGYNAAQIDSIFRKTNFDNLMSDYIPRSSKNFYEKRNDELYAISLPFSNFKIGIPEALSKGVYNYNLLSTLTRNVRHVRDFNKLPIPFLCIATNIETGEQVILDKGNLAQAMAASSAFPTLFSPVEIDGKLLVDGGVVNNYPIKEVRNMGADIIIGVDVQDDLLNRRDLKDATRIMSQIGNLQTIENMKSKIKNTDIYIKPNIKDYSIISFDKGEEIIRRGEEATFADYEKIQALVRKQGYYYKKLPLKVVSDSLKIENINCNPLDNYTNEYITSKLRFKPGAEITYKDLLKGINNLNATHNFNTISYSLDPSGNNSDDLNLTLKENPTQTYLKFGLHYDGLYKSAVLVNVTHKKTFSKNDITSLDLVLGDNFRYNFDYYIENGFNISFGFKSRLTEFSRNISSELSSNTDAFINYRGLDLINLDFFNVTNQVYFQSIFLNKFLIGGGVEHKYLKIKSSTLASINPVLDKSNYFSLFGYLNYDSFDNKDFPKRGWILSGNAQSYLFSSNYTNMFEPFITAKAEIGVAATLFDKATFVFKTNAGLTLGKTSIPFFNYVLGGYGYDKTDNFNYFYGYDFLSLAGNSVIRSELTLDYELYKRNHINFAASFANIGNNIFDGVKWISIPKYSGYALGYGLETMIGPLEIKYSWSPETQKNYFWFKVGFVF